MSEIKKPNPNPARTLQMVLIGLTILFAIITGTSFFIIPSWYAPLLVLAGIIAVIVFFTWLTKPIWALYFTLFMILLPTSLIPAQVNSYVNRIATVIALAVWVIDIIRRRSRIHLTASTLLMFGFIIWAAITILWADNFEAAKVVLQQYVLRLVLFMILFVDEIKTKKDFDGLMKILTLNGVLLIMISALTVILQGYDAGSRLQVLGENANGLGISLLVTMPAVLWVSLQPTKHNNNLKKWLAFIFLLASIGIIGLSGSRGSAISMAITLLAFLIWKPTRAWGALGLLIIGLAIIVAPIIFSTTIGRFLGSPGESILGGRETIWPAGWQLIKDHLLTGVGIGNSSYQVIPILMVPTPLHNPILVIWADTGLPGLLLYLGVLATAVITFLRKYLQSGKTGGGNLISYYALVSSVFIGYMASWIKGGGMESDFSYFMMVALLLIPSSSIEKSLD
jgi:putative inorganic carbon (HCO3(-)) transporter